VVFTGPPVSSTNKTDHHDITEILLRVALNTIKQTNKQTNKQTKKKRLLCMASFYLTICLVFLSFSPIFYAYR
jgi:hypothetical protein